MTRLHIEQGMPVDQGPVVSAIDLRPTQGDLATAGTGFRLWAVFAKDCLRAGMDPASAVSYLSERVRMARCCLVCSRIPALDVIDPEDCWLAIAAEALTGTPDDVHDAFEFFGEAWAMAVVSHDADDETVRAHLAPVKRALHGEAPQAWLEQGLLRAAHWQDPINPRHGRRFTMRSFDLFSHRQQDQVLDRSYQTLSDLIDGKMSDEIDPADYAGPARVTAQVVSAWHRYVNEQIEEVDTLQRSVTELANQLIEALLNAQVMEAEWAALGRSQALFSFDLNGNLLEANEHFCQITGHALEAIRGQHHSMLVDPVGRASSECAFWAGLSAGQCETGRYKLLAKDGREIWVQASYNPVLDPRGCVYKVLVSACRSNEGSSVNEASRSRA